MIPPADCRRGALDARHVRSITDVDCPSMNATRPEPILDVTDPAPTAGSRDVAAVSLAGIVKRFGDVVASDGADFEAGPGEIHALLGENGAGKTSLMNVLAGVYRPDAGAIRIDGRSVSVGSPQAAKRLGIGMVHQEQRLVTRFTAPENISLGHRFPVWFTLRRRFRDLAGRLSAEFGLPIDAETPVWAMPLGRRQRVEVVKLLHHGARIIILDEPTANLAPTEVETFFGALRGLVGEGRTVIFITHKLDEVLRFTDRVTVMRGGRVFRTLATRDASREVLNRLMVGESVSVSPREGSEPQSPIETTHDLYGGDVRTRAVAAPGDVVLKLDRVSLTDPSQPVNLTDATLSVRSGEVLAVAGVAGNGQTQLAEAITGLVKTASGRIQIGVRDLRGLSVRQISDLGVAYVPEDRREVGLVLSQTVATNLALRRYDRRPLNRFGFVDRGRIRRDAIELIDRYGIRPADPDVVVGRLSGGNQQRVIIAREFAGAPRLIIVDNFTRGLDPRSTLQFTDELFAHRDRGAAVIWITSDLSEALECDRIAVVNRGRIAAVLDRDDATRERVGLLMSEGISSGTPDDDPLSGRATAVTPSDGTAPKVLS
ncbi:MAG: ABC transporter ATP-binding protein [Chloroflexi bacterium]|nr:MAG: ABC transporter ATP-binding protein [Chloroflexota bacterium]